MADADHHQSNRFRSRAPGLPEGGAPLTPPSTVPIRRRIRFLLEAVADEVREDLEYGRGLYWVPVLLAVGVFGYFALPREPWLSALFLVCIPFAVATSWDRGNSTRRLLCSIILFFLLGVIIAKIQVGVVTAPIIPSATTVEVIGYVEELKPNDRGRVRLTVRVYRFETAAGVGGSQPKRVQVSARQEQWLKTGDAVSFKARLFPPQGPVLPGGYDFARDRFFDGVGASGYVYGRVHPSAAPPPDWRLRFLIARDGLREAIGQRLRSQMADREASVAVALITGDRSLLAFDTQESLRTAGLAHVLAISGLHMMLVAGSMFFAFRAVLASIPEAALYLPVKKIAAIAALLVGAGYLLLSGAAVATERAFIMTAVAFVAVLLDRPVVSMHTVAVAAVLIIIVNPEAVAGPGFQMSFLAVVSLVAVFQERWSRSDAPHAPGTKSRLWWRWLNGVATSVRQNGKAIVISSLVAGSATAPIAAYTFHRVAPLGFAANLAAMPLVSTLVMPIALLWVLLIPFGLDPLVAPILEFGLHHVLNIADQATELGGAGLIGRQTIFLPLFSISGILLLALLKSRVRYVGCLFIAAGLALSPWTKQADLLISEDGRTAAIREATGELAFVSARVPTFLSSVWFRADGDTRTSDQVLQSKHSLCDDLSCKYLWYAPVMKPGSDHSSATSYLPLANETPPHADENSGDPQPDESTAERFIQTFTAYRRYPDPDEKTGGPQGRSPPSGTFEINLPPDRPTRIEVVQEPKGLTPACRHADIVITPFKLRYPCRSALLVLDDATLTQTGALEMRLTNRTNGPPTLLIRPSIQNHYRPWTSWRRPDR